MKEVKFRIWDRVNKRWDLNSSDYEFTVEWDKHVDDLHKRYFIYSRDGHKYAFMRYTGLKDKEGTDIYEGDISMNVFGEKKEVVFSGGCFIYKNKDEFDLINQYHNVQVVGNIYENPELLDK